MSDDRGKYQAAFDLMLRISTDESMASRMHPGINEKIVGDYVPRPKEYWLDLYTTCLKRIDGERSSAPRRVMK